jgi:hypothetical protein
LPLDAKLDALGLGKIMNYYSDCKHPHVPLSYVLELELADGTQESHSRLLALLEHEFEIPRGSFLVQYSGAYARVGTMYGIKLIIREKNALDSDKINLTIDTIVSKVNETFANNSVLTCRWDSYDEIIVVFYGHSFTEIQKIIESFIKINQIEHMCSVVRTA